MSNESGKTIKRRGLVKTHANVDHEVWQWKKLQEQVKGGRVTKAEVQAYAIKAYHHVGILNFKASDGWYRRWRVRWQQISENSPSLNALRLPEEESGNYEPASNTKFQYQPITVNTLENPAISEESAETATVEQTTNKSEDSNAAKNRHDFGFNSVPQGREITQVESENHIGVLYSHEEYCGLQTVNIDIRSEEGQQTTDSAFVRSDCLNMNKSLPDFETERNAGMNVQDARTQDNLCEVDSQAIQSTDAVSDYLEIHAELAINDEQSITSKTDRVKNTVTEVVVSTLYDSVPTDVELRLTPPSSSVSFDTFYSSPSLVYQNEFDFGDELFCDTCEDFHSRCPGSLVKCRKRVKRTEDKLLLSGVNRGKESVAGGLQEVLLTAEESNLAEEKKLYNPGIQNTKGRRYLDQFKNRVVTFALSHTAKMAASKYKINRGTVCEWLTQHRKNNTTEPKKIISKEQDPKLTDEEFLRWLEDSKFNLTNERLKQKTVPWLTPEDVHKSSQWLRMYAHRLHGSQNSSNKKRYIAYPEVFKRMAVFHALTHSNMAAARVFGVARRRIIEWQSLAGASKSGENNQERSARVADSSVDREVFAWYSAQHPTPSAHQVRSKARALYAAAGRPVGCCAGWYYRWRARHRLPPARQAPCPSAHSRLLSWAIVRLEQRGLTHRALADRATALGIAQVTKNWTARFCGRHRNLLQDPLQPSAKLPDDLEKEARDFRATLGPSLDSIILSQVVSMDQVLLHFIPADQKAKKSVLWRPPLRSATASLVVSCSADGTLLPSMLILKGDELPTSSDPRAVCASTDTGIMNEEIFLKWINEVVLNYLQGDEGGLLVTSSAPPGNCQAGASLLASCRVRHMATPPGTAGRLLPALPLANKFRSVIEELGLASLEGQSSTLLTPSANQLLKWTLEVHNYMAKVSVEDIRRAFQEMLLVKNNAATTEPD